MTKPLSRSRGDLVVGFWAFAPAIVIPLLLYVWFHRVSRFPSDAADFDRLERTYSSLADHLVLWIFLGGALYVAALIVVIRDIWMRPVLDQNLRIMWTILTLLFAPIGGIVYWVVACRSRG